MLITENLKNEVFKSLTASSKLAALFASFSVIIPNLSDFFINLSKEAGANCNSLIVCVLIPKFCAKSNCP